MNMYTLYSKYFQKSKVFIYPLLGIKRGNNVVPHETYISWNDTFAPEDMRSVVLKIVAGEGATGAAFENDKTVFSREKEVLLPGLADVNVTKAYKDPDGVIRIEGVYEPAKKEKE
jgi:hypothetical protein